MNKPLFFCPTWGLEHLPLPDVLSRIKEAGYDGAEIAIDPARMDLREIRSLFDANDLLLLAQHPFATGGTPEEMRNDFSHKLKQILELEPLKVNCHTGKDFWSIDDNSLILEEALKIEQQTTIPIAHETHRGRFSFSLVHTLPYLQRFPELKLTADFSPWCVVSESLLGDQQHFLNQVIPHAEHMHARVGGEETPQVSHPNAPENNEELEAHLAWWKSLFQHQWAQQKQPTVTCEFGPPGYLFTLPFTNQPVADQWEINIFMKNLLTNLYKDWI